ISHYRDVVYSLKEHNLEPVITLHHFTNPAWFSRLGGWLNKDAHKYFLRYTETIVDALSDSVHYWVTINEPMVYIYNCYIKGLWPPQERSFPKAKQATDNLISAHIKAYKLIHGIYKKKGLPNPAVSIAKNMQPFEACSSTFRNNLSVYLRDRAFNYNFLNKLVHAHSLDFIGLNYYSRTLVDTRGWAVKNLFLDTCEKGHSKLSKNYLGWDIYPQGLYKMLMGLKKFRLPVFILENGICTEDDLERWDFIRAHLQELHRAMQEGVPVLGYLYWSLIDNFEWDKGFAPRFGLIQVDYNTYRRTPRQSADRFAQVCKSGILE
ncbi:MAG: family 1 glycosylhydrolase, partial [Candidatus Omnitrophica bacterium]|nr:family 1 glycosylhydrolase [Candidatus Omnitrophota bacterium]